MTEAAINTAKDSNTANAGATSLLSSKGVKTIILAAPVADFEASLKQAGITCYKTNGTIKTLISK